MKDTIISIEMDGKEIARGSLHLIDRILYEYREGYIQAEGDKSREDIACSLLGISPTITAAQMASLWNYVQGKKQDIFNTALATAKEESPGTYVPSPVESAVVTLSRSTPAAKSDPMSVTPEEAISLRKIAYMVAYIASDLNPEWGDYVELQGGISPDVIEHRKSLRRRH